MSRKTVIRLHCGNYSVEDWLRRESIGISVEGCNNIIHVQLALCCDCKDISLRNGNLDAGWECIFNLWSNLISSTVRKRGSIQANDGILISDRIQVPRGNDMELLSELACACLIDEGRRHFLKSDDIRFTVSVFQYCHRMRDFLFVQVLHHGLFQVLPNVWRRYSIHHVNKNGVKNSTAHRLQRKRICFFLCSDIWVFSFVDRLKQLVRYFFFHGCFPLDTQFVIEHEGFPRSPPLFHRREVVCIHVDNGGPVNLAIAAFNVDGVGNAIGHRRQPLAPQFGILQEIRDDSSVPKVRFPVAAYAFPSDAGEPGIQFRKHVLGENLVDFDVLVPRILQEFLDIDH
mmetsp:Transcript_39140/g.60277  ORF Transcript_39140/g.60277 Transcript_39140/m.60277 type:complete len:343 (+) Transcript_39140:494-1522(+)